MWIWVTIPVVSALIGWGTNLLAIRFLFHPRRQIRFLGLTWQGLIPRRQSELASKTAEIIERELLQQHFLRDNVASINLQPHLKKLLHVLIHQKLADKLKSIPFLGGFIGPSTLSTLESMALEELEHQMKPIMQEVAKDIETKIDIRTHIEQQINQFSLTELENMIYKIAAREFRGIEIMGGVLGGLIGLFHALLFHFGILA